MRSYKVISHFLLFVFLCVSAHGFKSGKLSRTASAKHPSILLGTFLLPSQPGTALKSAVSLANFLPVDTIVADITTTTFCATAALLWLQFWITLAKDGKIDPKLSRKIIHTGSAPLYIALFPLFSNEPTACLFAASVPLSQLLRLVAAYRASGETNTGLVQAISRTGDKKEALQGPLYYNIILFLVSLFAFRSSIPGVFVIGQMAAGDGMADIVGRKFGARKWPFSTSKSIAGSLGFVAGAFTATLALLYIYSATGCISFDISMQWPLVLLISFICAAVELVPIGDDNITVSIAALVASYLLF